MKISKNSPRIRGFSTSRLEAFSDGVFAIAITLLVLDITVPIGAEKHLFRALVDQWPIYLAYFVSFATIGAAWFAHSAITEYLDRADRGLVRINILLLMLISFLPFPTKLLAEYIGSTEPERVAVTLYGVVLMSVSVLISLLWKHAINNKLIKVESNEDDIQVISIRLKPSLIAYIILLVLGLFLPIAAVVGYLLIALYILFPAHIRRTSKN